VVRHIGFMNSQTHHNVKNNIGAALLSAVTLGEILSDERTQEEGSATLRIAGQAVIEFQINQMARHGISRIFIEIETLPGFLTAVADRVTAAGVSIEFVRSPAELRGKLDAGQFLFVLSENVYADDLLLAEIVLEQNAFILTVDGREENAVFERIDLQSHWSGIAMLSAASVESIAALPPEWSISSSLLRRALQDSVVHRPVKQDILVARQLCKIVTAADADLLSTRLIRQQSSAVDGMVEKYLFAPIAAAITPFLWKYHSAKNSLLIAAWFSLAIVMGTAVGGYPVVSSITSLIAMFILQVSILLKKSDDKLSYDIASNILPLTVFAVSFLAIFWNWPGQRTENLFCGGIVCGLFWLSKKSIADNSQRGLLCSKAVIAALTFVFAASGMLVAGFMLIGLLQLSALILIRRND
jgi:energy-converting hydrogenase Eha subunit A